MAAKRESVIFNVDGGLWFKRNVLIGGNPGGAVDLSVGAERYDNITDFQNIVPNLAWNPNLWGDQNRLLSDSKFGFKIVESIFTSPPISTPYTNASPLSPGSTNAARGAKRESVMYSYEYNSYLYIKDGWEALPPDQVQYAWVRRNDEATRFTNTLPFANLLDNSIIGDFSLPWGIEQYVFTRGVSQPRSLNYFSGPPSGPRNIERAYIAFSKAKGRYLLIDNPNDPYAQMTFQYVNTPCCAWRFQNTITFQDIMDNTVLGNEAYGWEIPQFYFNRDARPPVEDPFTQFWCIDQNGPYECIGYRTLTCDWLCDMAIKFSKDFIEYVKYVTQYLLEEGCYPDPEAFHIWWGQQDYAAFEQWLYDFWKACIENEGKYIP